MKRRNSIVLPTLNSRGTLGTCLQSIQTQSLLRNRYAIMLADAGSTGDTLEIARLRGGQDR